MLKSIAPLREQDRYGSGEFGAPRGDSTHKGVDVRMTPGAVLLAPVPGKVSKINFMYADDPSFRYVEITDHLGYRIRFFYIQPQVTLGDYVFENAPLGVVQSLQKRYPGIQDHVHLEVMQGPEYISYFQYLHQRGQGITA